MRNNLSEKQKESIYFGAMMIVHILYLFTFLGVAYLDKHYVRLFNVIVQITISSILILRFNKYSQHRITSFDKTLIISAASFLLFNLFITEIYAGYIVNEKWFNDIKTDIVTYL